MGDKEELNLPKATVNKVIKDCLPPEIKIAADVRDIIADASLEFLQLLSSEANEICTKENKSTISAEHILKALETLSFTEYIEDVKAYHAKLKKEATERSDRNKANENSEGLTQEELIAKQQALFASAEK